MGVHLELPTMGRDEIDDLLWGGCLAEDKLKQASTIGGGRYFDLLINEHLETSGEVLASLALSSDGDAGSGP